MREQAATVVWLAVLSIMVALVAVGMWQVRGEDPLLLTRHRQPKGIMGTQCQIKAVVPADQIELAEASFDAAENVLRNIESLMSWRLDGSDIARINAAESGVIVPVSEETSRVITMAKDFTGYTHGAFDVTYAPLYDLWRPGKTEQLPTLEEIARARKISGWDNFDLHPDTVVKHYDKSRMDLGALAKGHAVDQAVNAMIGSGISGGLVNVGGDIRCFGKRPDGGPWRIVIESPFKPDNGEHLGILLLTQGAVCTSGNYRRYSEIDGKRYSHIVDPRSGWPVGSVPSVTVVAKTAAVADAWATALSVLGPDGLALIEPIPGLEAMMVTGDEANYKTHTTTGFGALLEKPATPSLSANTSGR